DGTPRVFVVTADADAPVSGFYPATIYELALGADGTPGAFTKLASSSIAQSAGNMVFSALGPTLLWPCQLDTDGSQQVMIQGLTGKDLRTPFVPHMNSSALSVSEMHEVVDPAGAGAWPRLSLAVTSKEGGFYVWNGASATGDGGETVLPNI